MQEWDINDFWAILRHRWRLILGIFALLSAVGMARIWLTTPVYRAEGKVLFSLSQATPLSLEENPVFSPAMIGAEFANRQERLTSVDFLTRVADQLPDSIRSRIRSDSLQPETIALAIQQGLNITTSREGSVYTIRFTHPDPVVAASVVNTLTTAFIKEDLRVRRMDVAQSLDYVETQLTKYGQSLQEAENRLRDFHERHGGISLSDLSQKLFQDLSKTDQRLQELLVQQQNIHNKIQAIKEEMAPFEVSQNVDLSPRLEELQNRLIEREVTLRTLQAQGLDTTNPRMRTLREEIQRLRQMLHQELRTSLFRPDAVALTDSLRNALFWMNIENRVLTGHITFLQNHRDSLQQQLERLPALEQTYLRLLRNREIAEKIYKMLLEKREELRIALESRTSPLQILERARIPHHPIRPRKVMEGTLTLLLSLLAGIGIALIREWRHPIFHNLEDLSSMTSEPILSVIPNRKDPSHIPPPRRRLDVLSTSDPFQESFYRLYTSLQPNLNSPESMVITSAVAHEGKSLILTNTAITFSQMGHRVCVVEADLRRPHIHLYFDIPPEPGLVELLEGKATLDDVLYVHPTGVSVIPAGTLPSQNPATLMRSPRISSLFQELKRRFDLILVDSPPIGITSDAAFLYPHVKDVILVVRVGITPLRLLQHVLATLPENKLRGLVVNGADPASTYGYYRYYYITHNSTSSNGWGRWFDIISSRLRRRISS